MFYVIKFLEKKVFLSKIEIIISKIQITTTTTMSIAKKSMFFKRVLWGVKPTREQAIQARNINEELEYEVRMEQGKLETTPDARLNDMRINLRIFMKHVAYTQWKLDCTIANIKECEASLLVEQDVAKVFALFLSLEFLRKQQPHDIEDVRLAKECLLEKRRYVSDHFPALLEEEILIEF